MLLIIQVWLTTLDSKLRHLYATQIQLVMGLFEWAHYWSTICLPGKWLFHSVLATHSTVMTKQLLRKITSDIKASFRYLCRGEMINLTIFFAEQFHPQFVN